MPSDPKNRVALTLTDWQRERLAELPAGDRSEYIRQALTEKLVRDDVKQETTMQGTIHCQPGESVFDALQRGVTEGVFPTGSQVITPGGPGRITPTCERQVGMIRVRSREWFAVQGPAE
jgi:hypothetical protein